MLSPYTGVMDPYAIPRRSNPYNIPSSRGGGYGIHSPLTEPYPRRKQQVDLMMPWDFGGQMDPDYLCMIFHGRRGDGKSTGATGLARYLYDVNHELDPDYKVYANYKVNFADMCHPRLVDALITFPPWLRKCLILIDEIAVYFPSIRATSTGALNFSTFLQEIRKLEVDLIFTTQFPTMIIGSANIQIDLFIRPHLYNKYYDPRFKKYLANSVRMDCVDWWGQWTGYPVQHRWPPEPQDIIAQPSLHNLRSVYRQFNTKEIIPAFWHPSRQNIIDREWEEEAQAELEEEEAQLAKTAAKPVQVKQDPRNLQELLEGIEERSIRLSSILKAAQKIDPQIKNYGNLAMAMRRLGWSCFQDGGKYGEWLGERLAQ